MFSTWGIAALGSGAQVTEALYDAGFGSSGRFYAAADAVLGMKPGAYRKGGAQAVRSGERDGHREVEAD